MGLSLQQAQRGVDVKGKKCDKQSRSTEAQVSAVAVRRAFERNRTYLIRAREEMLIFTPAGNSETKQGAM